MKPELYLISPPELGDDFADRLTRALDAGPVAAFQLRMKDVEDDAIIAVAEQLMPVCAERGCAFVLNDRADLAAQLGVDGVHLGRSDGSIKEARALLGKDVQIGATCHDSRHFAMEAGEAGADYVAFGAFYETQTKETVHRPESEILTWWSNMFVLPCVAIGGITADNAAPLIEAGADFIAVCSAVWNHPDGEAAGIQAMIEAMQTGKKTDPQ